MLSTPVLLFTILGFFSGSVMYSYIIPRMICGRDVRDSAADRNPGAANATATCGLGVGILCGALDVLKAFLPVFTACLLGVAEGWEIVPIVIAPVLGHAFSPMMHFKGGKAITTVYGALLGLMPWHRLGLVLAACMALCVCLIKNHAAAITASALLFVIGSAMVFPAQGAIRLTACLISLVLIYKHFGEAREYLLERIAKRRSKTA